MKRPLQVSGDGAYDKRKCYEAIAARVAQATIPPRKNAMRWEEESALRGGTSSQSSAGTY